MRNTHDWKLSSIPPEFSELHSACLAHKAKPHSPHQPADTNHSAYIGLAKRYLNEQLPTTRGSLNMQLFVLQSSKDDFRVGCLDTLNTCVNRSRRCVSLSTFDGITGERLKP
jgi:hypothetical protein